MRDCGHDVVLHRRPIVQKLRITDSNHQVPVELEDRVVAIVLHSLLPHMMAAVDLKNEALAEKEVDSVPVDPCLRNNPDSLPSQPVVDEGFQA